MLYIRGCILVRISASCVRLICAFFVLSQANPIHDRVGVRQMMFKVWLPLPVGLFYVV